MPSLLVEVAGGEVQGAVLGCKCHSGADARRNRKVRPQAADPGPLLARRSRSKTARRTSATPLIRDVRQFGRLDTVAQ